MIEIIIIKLLKGRISRTLASKCSLCFRVDALGEEENAEIAFEMPRVRREALAIAGAKRAGRVRSQASN